MTDDDERSAAEDYRQQRQRAEARKSGYIPTGEDSLRTWIDENEGLIHQIALANGARGEDVAALVEEYKLTLLAAPPGSEFDDANVQHILQNIVNEIESKCRERNVPIRGGVVFGVSPEFGAVISQASVPTTNVSIIAASLPFVTFCNQIAKLLARSLPAIERDNAVRISNDPVEVRRYIEGNPQLASEWGRTIAQYAIFGWPARQLSPSPQGPAQVTRILLLRSLEIFSVGHEYGHHVMMHGVLASSEERRDAFQQEHDADIFARAISMAIGLSEPDPNIYAASGAGAVIMLGALDLVRRARAILETGNDNLLPRKSHPPLAARIDAIAGLDANLPDDLKAAAADMRDCFHTIIEDLWAKVRPSLIELHALGIRPQDDGPDLGGWLPL